MAAFCFASLQVQQRRGAGDCVQGGLLLPSGWISETEALRNDQRFEKLVASLAPK
jgi:hypothetical protein